MRDTKSAVVLRQQVVIYGHTLYRDTIPNPKSGLGRDEVQQQEQQCDAYDKAVHVPAWRGGGEVAVAINSR